MKIFLSGSTGVIGRRLVPQLIAAGHDVTALARSQEKAAKLREDGARPVTVDLADANALAGTLEGHEVVINLATHVPPSSRALLPGAWKEMNDLRSTLPAAIAAAARRSGVGRMIQESFGPTYPDQGDRWIDESVPLAPERFAIGILAAEQAVETFRQSGGDGVVLRFTYFYGPDSDFTKDMMAMARHGWAATPGPQDAYVSSVSHDDAASSVIAALTVPSGTYNVCDDEPVTHREFYDSLAAALGAKRPRFAPAWMARMLGPVGRELARSQRISNSAFRAASRWTPRYRSIREGWQAVVRHANGPA